MVFVESVFAKPETPRNDERTSKVQMGMALLSMGRITADQFCDLMEELQEEFETQDVDDPLRKGPLCGQGAQSVQKINKNLSINYVLYIVLFYLSILNVSQSEVALMSPP